MPQPVDLRTTFDSQADLYHAVRPHYPDALFDALVAHTQLSAAAPVLEIGPGTGQATQSMAQRGYTITAVELGAALAQVAREALRAYSNVEIINAAFEAVDLPPAHFDLVYAATAFHWIDPAVRFSKPHRLLKDGGHLAILRAHHVSDEAGDRFFFASQPIYKTYDPDHYDADLRPTRTADLTAHAVDEDYFSPVYFGTFPLTVHYSAAAYAQLLNTYSPTLALPPAQRTGFLNAMARLIETEFDGHLDKHYAMSLTLAAKR